jgi:hypothetical protein
MGEHVGERRDPILAVALVNTSRLVKTNLVRAEPDCFRFPTSRHLLRSCNLSRRLTPRSNQRLPTILSQELEKLRPSHDTTRSSRALYQQIAVVGWNNRG